ncbi:MAG: chromate efflux transporter [Deltaproteobacteria bacterium]|nr:chromate efflux transporter [Deltaproteobacteria bacterium]
MIKKYLNAWHELWKYFFYIGFSYGPMVYTLARTEFVEKLKLLGNKDITEGIAVGEVMPGAVFVDFVSYLGFLIKKRKGAFLAMMFFIAPSFLLMLVLSMLYMKYGQLPMIQNIMRGLSAIMIALIIKVVIDIYKTGVKNPLCLVVSAVALGLLLLNVNIVLILLAGILIVFSYGISRKDLVVREVHVQWPSRAGMNFFMKNNLWVVWLVLLLIMVNATIDHISPAVALMNGNLFKIGLLTFGNGYTMLPFISKEVVSNYHWLTPKEFSDGIVMGQITPGPVVITATFIGYKVGGFFGALTATASIFMPSTILVALVAKPFIKYKDNPWVLSALKGILASFIGLLALVVAQLAKTNITDYKTALFALASLVLFVYTKINPVILLILGIIVSLLIFR